MCLLPDPFPGVHLANKTLPPKSCPCKDSSPFECLVYSLNLFYLKCEIKFKNLFSQCLLATVALINDSLWPESSFSIKALEKSYNNTGSDLNTFPIGQPSVLLHAVGYFLFPKGGAPWASFIPPLEFSPGLLACRQLVKPRSWKVKDG